MVFDIIIIVLLLGVIGGGVYFFLQSKQSTSQLTSQIDSYHIRAEEEKKFIVFTPYLARIPKDTEVFDENRQIISTISANSFCTIVFEKDNMCQILAGGWINKDNVQKDFTRVENKIPARLKEDTMVRNGPSYGYKTIGRLFKGQIVEIKTDYGNWYKISISDNVDGYILKSLCEK